MRIAVEDIGVCLTESGRAGSRQRAIPTLRQMHSAGRGTGHHTAVPDAILTQLERNRITLEIYQKRLPLSPSFPVIC
jgi:hypothetical protein